MELQTAELTTKTSWPPLDGLVSWILIAAISYICFCSHLGALGLVGPDEPRYAEVAREMAETGDWITPRLHGRPWFEKPVLYYWGAALGFQLFGVSEVAARLPSALAAALAVLALALAGWRFHGLAASRSVLFIFPTCFGVIGFARAATPDMLFSGTLAAAMVAAYWIVCNEQGLRHSEGVTAKYTASLVRGLFGFFLGAATLAKGPAALVLAGGSIGTWALATRRWRDALRLLHPLSIALFCVTALPWYVLCAARNPEFLRTFLLAHNVERYLTPIFRHQQPFWFYGPVLLLGLLPWTPLLYAPLRQAARDAAPLWRRGQGASSPALFWASWVIFPLLFFSLSQSKLPGYVLPAAAPLTLLLSGYVARHSEERSMAGRVLFAAVGAAYVALAIAAAFALRHIHVEFTPNSAGITTWVAVAIAGGSGIAILGLLRKPQAALLVTVALTAGLTEGANRQALPQWDAYLSARAAARAGTARVARTDRLSVFRLHRAWQYGLHFYLHQEIPEWSPPSPPPEWLYTNAAGLSELERLGVKYAVADRGSPRAMLVRVLPSPEDWNKRTMP